ncbi:MAG: hypothetical protein KJ971_07555 [Firmicutes bacterium]|nr:hypothetical protein [Bacillota bacterium]
MKNSKLLVFLLLIVSYFFLGGMVSENTSAFELNVGTVPDVVALNTDFTLNAEIKNVSYNFQKIEYGYNIISVYVDGENPAEVVTFSIGHSGYLLPSDSLSVEKTLQFSTIGIHEVKLISSFYVGDELITYEQMYFIQVV